LTGRTDRNEKKWSSYARGYVINIMRLRRKAPAGGFATPARTSSRSSKGDWRRAATKQRLHLGVHGRSWPKRGLLRDGQVLKVKAARTTGQGERWIQVVTADGRLGWLKQHRTVPAKRPAAPRRWVNVVDEGRAALRRDRSRVRPRPR
jgi:hypothetical protein